MTSNARTITVQTDEASIIEVRNDAGRYLFEIIASADDRGEYVQVRGARLRQMTVEPRADNVIRVRDVIS